MQHPGPLRTRWGSTSELGGDTTAGNSRPPGRNFGPIESRYTIRRHLRDGGSASVYEAYDQQMMRPVAIKRYVVEATAEKTLQRFWREARLTGWLAHPNIVPVYDVLPRQDGGCDLVMKLVEGETFAERIARRMQAPHDPDVLEQHLRDLLKVCDAIDFAHSRGVVHRDLKPTNIMVGAHGEVYVMDWGISKVLPGGGPVSIDPDSGERHSIDEAPEYVLPPDQGRDTSTIPISTSRGAVVGTPAYMAPEQAEGSIDDVDARTDIFGLGALLYETLTGAAPYTGNNLPQLIKAARTRDLVPPDERSPQRPVSPELRRICLKAMALRKEDRQQSVRELAEDLLEILRGGGWFEIQHFAAGEVIVREGDVAESAFVLKSGRCRVVKAQGQHEQLLRVLQAGDMFGEVGLITGEARSATVIADEPVEVQVLSSRGMKQSLAHQGLVGRFLEALAERFLDVDRKLFEERRAKSQRE